MKITLDSCPSDAPGCMKLIAEDGRDILIQTDYDYPGIAMAFGWILITLPIAGYDADWREHQEDYSNSDKRTFCNYEKQRDCKHSSSDGTVDCPDCGVTASEFIAAASNWLHDNDGAEAEDPGYMDGAEPSEALLLKEDIADLKVEIEMAQERKEEGEEHLREAQREIDDAIMDIKEFQIGLERLNNELHDKQL